MMKDNTEEIWTVISSALGGQATDEEKQILDQWISENEDNKKTFQYLSQVGFTGKAAQMAASKDKLYQRLLQKIQEDKYRKSIAIWRYVAAASIILLVMVGSWSALHGVWDSTPVTYVETHTPAGITSKILLSDGSVVHLNAGSSLSYPTKFSGKNRDVRLIGEAYFEVTKDSRHPFIVKADTIEVRVLGTHFNVKAYSEDKEITATLIEGSILIGNIDKTSLNGAVLLKPNQQAIYHKGLSNIQINKVDAALFASWRNGQFYFERERFSEIAKQLERSFRVKITIRSEKLADKLYSGQFDHGESLTQILDIMKRHQDFNYKVLKDSIVIF